MRSDSFTELSQLRAAIAARIQPFVRDDVGGGLEEQCRLYLRAFRWPERVRCPRCRESSRLPFLESRSKWHCCSCRGRYQFSVTAGTLYHRLHLPVWKWLGAVHLMLDAPEGVSAAELRRRLGGSSKTAWFAAHRIRAAMRSRGNAVLCCTVDAESRATLPGEAPARERRLLTTLSKASLGVLSVGLAGPVARSSGPHRNLSAKHLVAYLDERRRRIVQPGTPYAFGDTILALLRGEGLSYVQPVAER